ncbi:MAG: glutathione S-transferase [Sulfitobacter sp.]|nr:glutathione S-transferase [Sulfitobacter sp.]
MADLSAFPITKKWPARNPDILQLYSFPTPNGVKASIMLEETGIPYEPHKVTLADEDVKSPEFLSLNPNNKIPAIIDPNGPDGPVGLFESGAILIYLGDKAQMLMGRNANERAKVIQWLMFQMGGLGPMLGQLGFFYRFAGSEWDDKRPQQRYIDEGKRLLSVLDLELAGKEWIAGDFSVADIAIAPWLGALEFYGAREAVDWEDRGNLVDYLERFKARPAVQKGMNIPSRD